MGGGALYAGQHGRTGQHWAFPGSEIRYHGKTLLALVAEAEALEESDPLPEPLLNLMDHAGLSQSV